ncbi:hypothetical protein [Nocardia noduli]|uniref:hypothetical protein n=1 Tax=Nocardia noduli TaxID=2815722 RepID=UPI001C23AC24|nr:hypothetical protein [Nocardia noduli]
MTGNRSTSDNVDTSTAETTNADSNGTDDRLVASLREVGLSDRQIDGLARALDADGHVGKNSTFGPKVSGWLFRFRTEEATSVVAAVMALLTNHLGLPTTS